MRKVIFIGEPALDVLMPKRSEHDMTEATVIPGGRLLNAAALLGAAGRETVFMGEVARDFAGDMIIDFLERHGVETRSIDRYTGGSTPINVIADGDIDTAICQRNYPEEDFDDIWPRVNEGDIVIFGSYFAISRRSRKRLKEFLGYSEERKAIIIYVPGFLPAQSRRITHEMPLILENLETADMVVTRTRDLKTIFGDTDDEAVYKKSIDFYCGPFVNVDSLHHELHFYNLRETASVDIADAESLESNSRILAGIAEGLIEQGVKKENLELLKGDTMKEILLTTKTLG